MEIDGSGDENGLIKDKLDIKGGNEREKKKKPFQQSMNQKRVAQGWNAVRSGSCEWRWQMEGVK